MADLAQFKNRTLSAIEGEPTPAEHRPYLGMSKLGHPCERYLWYSFRWAYQQMLSNRMRRLFNRGHREEPAIIAELKKIGIHCYGDQTEVVAAYGHSMGHNDGICIGVLEAPKTEHLAEFKTMSDKYFKDVCKKGVKLSKPIYYAQMQIYMKKLKLTRALFIAVNKNTDAWHVERIKFDSDFADELEAKAETIVLSEEPPAKRFKPTWMDCKWCDARQICHMGADVQENCRTCEYCDIHDKGVFKCSQLGIILATDQQRIGCDRYYKLNYL